MTGQVVAADPRQQLAQLLPELRAFARMLSSGRAEADDLVQEALVRALRGLDGGTPDDLRTWCFAILRNVLHEQLRARRREAPGIEAALPEPAIAGAQEARTDLRDVSAALARLPPLLREALVLVGAQGLGYEAAAAIAGVPVGTMKARVSRARALLGAEFREALPAS